MALIYARGGFRDYHASPVPLYRRTCWEFQAFTEGSCEMTALAADGARMHLPIRSPLLCVSGPGYAHGWQAAAGETCETCVFHFDEVDEVLAAAAGDSQYLEVPLPPASLQRLTQLLELAEEDARHPGEISGIVCALVLAEMSLMALRTPAPSALRAPDSLGIAQRRVRSAMAWYESHLHEGPGFEQMAAASHVSVPHLRRFFHRTLGVAPSEAMARLQFQRAQELLQNPANKLETVAENCGFGSASSFSRAFRRRFGRSPRGS